MAAPVQGITTLLAHQLLTNDPTSAAAMSIVGTEVDVRTWLSAKVYVYHAVIEAAANDPGISYILQSRWSTASGLNEDWIPVWTFTSGSASGVASEITGTEAIGEQSIAVDADPTASFTPGTECYVEDTGVVADGEWGRVALSETSADIVNLVDGLTTAKDSADTIWTQAGTFQGTVSLAEVSWLRMIVQTTSTSAGADIHFKANMVQFQSFA